MSARRKAVPAPVRRGGSGRKLIAFGWYGGKFSHLDWILPLLPPCHHYCEPFAGSAAVLLNRPPSPVETYNDLDGERSEEHTSELQSPDHLVCRLLLEKKKKKNIRTKILNNTNTI